MAIFHHKLLSKEGKDFGQRVNSSIIHDKYLFTIHKRCHPESYHSDINDHMTLNIILSVVDTYKPYLTKWASLSLVTLESSEQAAYMEIHLKNPIPQHYMNKM